MIMQIKGSFLHGRTIRLVDGKTYQYLIVLGHSKFKPLAQLGQSPLDFAIQQFNLHGSI